MPACVSRPRAAEQERCVWPSLAGRTAISRMHRPRGAKMASSWRCSAALSLSPAASVSCTMRCSRCRCCAAALSRRFCARVGPCGHCADLFQVAGPGQVDSSQLGKLSHAVLHQKVVLRSYRGKQSCRLCSRAFRTGWPGGQIATAVGDCSSRLSLLQRPQEQPSTRAVCRTLPSPCSASSAAAAGAASATPKSARLRCVSSACWRSSSATSSRSASSCSPTHEIAACAEQACWTATGRRTLCFLPAFLAASFSCLVSCRACARQGWCSGHAGCAGCASHATAGLSPSCGAAASGRGSPHLRGWALAG